MFIWFLEKNKHTLNKNGEIKINDNAIIPKFIFKYILLNKLIFFIFLTLNHQKSLCPMGIGQSFFNNL